MNKWEKHLGVPYPECKMTGQCCRFVTPSLPAPKLLKKASEGDPFARDFLNLFQPYESIEEFREEFSEFIDRAFKSAKKSSKFNDTDQLVFFRCRFLKGKNECLVYEDRPQLCRSYPDSPLLLMHPGCAFEEWARECKKRYYKMHEELKVLKDVQQALKEEDKIITRDSNRFFSSFLVSPSATWME